MQQIHSFFTWNSVIPWVYWESAPQITLYASLFSFFSCNVGTWSINVISTIGHFPTPSIFLKFFPLKNRILRLPSRKTQDSAPLCSDGQASSVVLTEPEADPSTPLFKTLQGSQLPAPSEWNPRLLLWLPPRLSHTVHTITELPVFILLRPRGTRLPSRPCCFVSSAWDALCQTDPRGPSSFRLCPPHVLAGEKGLSCACSLSPYSKYVNWSP